jgi:hypothetical protein
MLQLSKSYSFGSNASPVPPVSFDDKEVPSWRVDASFDFEYGWWNYTEQLEKLAGRKSDMFTVSDNRRIMLWEKLTVRTATALARKIGKSKAPNLKVTFQDPNLIA